MKSYRFKLLTISIFILALIVIYIYDQSNRFMVRSVEIGSDKIEEDIKISQITDFHSNSLIDVDDLASRIESYDPDLVAITGDLIDARDKSVETAIELLESLAELDKDIYYVKGNHEEDSSIYDELKYRMNGLGIHVLEDDIEETTTIDGENISIMGTRFYKGSQEDYESYTYSSLASQLDQDDYNIVLRHDPNNIDSLLLESEDLVLSGHTHGGQVRLPIIGAIIAPGQGLFPKYDQGEFDLGDTILYIDSGLGNSKAPIRTLNRVQISNIYISAEK